MSTHPNHPHKSAGGGNIKNNARPCELWANFARTLGPNLGAQLIREDLELR